MILLKFYKSEWQVLRIGFLKLVNNSLRPNLADRDWPLLGDEFDRMNFNNYHFATFKDFSEWE